MNETKRYILNEPVSMYSKGFIAKEVEKLVEVGDRQVIVIQKRHIPTNRRWITVVGYVLEQLEPTENQEYLVQPVIDQEEIDALRPAIDADSSLEKRLQLCAHWSRITRI